MKPLPTKKEWPTGKTITITLVALIALLFSTTSFAWTGRVLRVVDGDTIEISYQGNLEKVRLLNVNTPESVHRDKRRNVPIGKVASKYTKKRLAGKSVILELGTPTRGKYGRLLAYVFIDGVNFNVELVRQGLSPYYIKYGKSDDYDQEFRNAEQSARKEKLNIWSDKNLISKNKSASEDKAEFEALEGKYIGNSRSLKLHRHDCIWGQRVSEKNRVIYRLRGASVADGYEACKVCLP